MVIQKQILLKAYPKGFHLITKEIEDMLSPLPEKGILHLFIQHTSAALTINENADFTVRSDFETFFNHLIPEHFPHFKHTMEGSDDMPAHIKASLFGQSITIPISQHKLQLGTWQGIYLCEFRKHGGQRSIIATIIS